MLNFFTKNEPFVNQKIMVDDNGQILEIDSNEFLREYGVTWSDEVVWTNKLTKSNGELSNWARAILDNEAKQYQLKVEFDILLKILMLSETSPILLPQLYINSISEIVGYGVFAGQEIHNGDFINEYTGEFGITRDLSKRESSYLIEENCLDEQFSWWIDSQRLGNYSRFINHSSEPNTKLYFTFFKEKYRVFVMAIKNIEPDEQVLLNYGKDYWSGIQEPIEL
jgi:hypothetical protein